MFLESLGMDQGTGTIGASSLGAIHGKSRTNQEAPLRRCQEPGCGTILRSGNPDDYCSLHAYPDERRGKKHTDSVALRRRRRMHVVRT
jgi:hypothetical protein